MTEEEKKINNKSEEDCPLCRVSEETLEKLKKRGRDKESQEKSIQNKKGFWNKFSKK